MPPPCLKLVRSPRNPPKKRERTKTFTGCWTCRTRKLKCDEAQPECRQCTSKSIPCGGYGTRLHWLPCVTGDESPEPGKPKVRLEAGQRRMVVRDPLDARFTEEEIDKALQEIQQANPGKGTYTKGPFHVFDGSAQRSLSDTNEFSEKDQWSPLPEIDFSGLLWAEGEQTFSPHPSIFEQPVENSFSPSLANSAVMSDSLISSESSTGMPRTYESSPASSTAGFQASNNVLELYQQQEEVLHQEDPKHRNGQYILAATPYRGLDDYPLEPRFMTSQNRLLLYHYVQNVVDLMATISTPNSPWKAIHLPASLQGSGELEATGHTPNGRNALLHAILASSASNLATQFEFSNQVELGQQYRLLGQELFCKSVALIRSCMQEELGGEKPKYKEILAAMLSMISIGVMAGETYATRLHLEGCESLIRASRERTTKSHSPKARVLHRIYYYLRIMQESTAATYELNLKLQPKQMQPALEHAGSEPQEKATSAMSLEQVTEWLSINSLSENETESFTYEFLYGVPQDLFKIVGQCTDLVQQINLFWASTPNPDSILPQDLVTRSNEVESLILNWPITKALASPNYQRATPSTQKIIHHQTHAFHQATIIFFSQHIRPIHRYHLQPYVLNVLNHIVAIEAIKTEEGVSGGALLWPGFIAASEAIEESVQKRFLDWFDAVARVGIGSSRCAKSVLVEVWEGRRMEGMEWGRKEVRPGSSWRSVAEGRGINLMLT